MHLSLFVLGALYFLIVIITDITSIELLLIKLAILVIGIIIVIKQNNLKSRNSRTGVFTCSWGRGWVSILDYLQLCMSWLQDKEHGIEKILTWQPHTVEW